MEEHHDASVSARPDPGSGDDATVISARQDLGRPEDASGAGGSTVPRPAGGRGSTAEIGALLEGTMLGPFRLDRFIGGGGMGAVFQALDTTLHRTVAIKVLARQQSDDEENLRRFRNEAQSAARLDHENIGRVHAVGTDRGWHYIVLEFIEGTNLRDLVREEGPFDPARTIDVAIQVAEALEHASEREVVHRDIKPSNIVITPAGRARIVDMGLARLHQVAGDGDLTASGMTLGTFDYISPEQARDPRAADVRSDLYSLGCTMFFMLAGRPPFAEGTMVQKLLQHQQSEPPAIDELRPDVPRRLAAIIDRLMTKDPDDRFQRPAVLAAELAACAEAEGLLVTAPRSTTVARSPRREAVSRLSWLVPVGLLAAVVGGLWMRSAAIRSGGEQGRTVAPAEPTAESVALPGSTAADSPTRIVTTAATLAEAIAAAVDGDVIEIDGDGPFDLPPVSVAGRRLTIRAAAARTPLVRIAAAADGTSVQIGTGRLTLRGLALQQPDGPRQGAGSGVARRSLFTLAGGGLECEAVLLRMPDPMQAAAPFEPAAFVQVVDRGDAATARETTIQFRGVRAAGEATVLDVQMPLGGQVRWRWESGAALTRRLVAAEGSRTGEASVTATLVDVVAGCSDGLAALRDSPALPRLPRLEMRASGCRFVVVDSSRAFIEQAGIAVPDAYLAACTWQDQHGRYEGTGVFQRIDGAAERVEVVFGQGGPALVHDPRVAPLPRPSDWEGWDG